MTSDHRPANPTRVELTSIYMRLLDMWSDSKNAGNETLCMAISDAMDDLDRAIQSV